MQGKPRFLIIGGPNGAGKTTVANRFSRLRSVPYLGADAIATAINPENPHEVRIKASKKFVELLDRTIQDRQSCVIESTLSGRSLIKWIHKAVSYDFEIEIVFVFVESESICLQRIEERVRKGGHDVPEEDVRRRFTRSMSNFWHKYRDLADMWSIFSNGNDVITDVARGSKLISIVIDPEIHSRYMKIVDSL